LYVVTFECDDVASQSICSRIDLSDDSAVSDAVSEGKTVSNTVGSNTVGGNTVDEASGVDSGDSGGSVDSGDSGGSVDGGNGVVGNADGVDSGVSHLLDGVGPGLMDNGLVDGLVGPDGAGHGDLSVDGDVLEDGLGGVVGTDNGGGLVGGDLGGDVGVGGLSDGVGQGGDLGHDIGVGVGLSGRVGEVASQPLVNDGGGVVGGGTHTESGGAGHNSGGNTGGGDLDGAGPGEGDQGREEQEGIHDWWLFL